MNLDPFSSFIAVFVLRNEFCVRMNFTHDSSGRSIGDSPIAFLPAGISLDALDLLQLRSFRFGWLSSVDL